MQVTPRRLGALIVTVYLILAVAMVVGFVAQNRNQSARRHIAIQEQQERTAAVCKAENETRQTLRDLARDLTNDPDVLRAVDTRLAAKDCNALDHN